MSDLEGIFASHEKVIRLVDYASHDLQDGMWVAPVLECLCKYKA